MADDAIDHSFERRRRSLVPPVWTADIWIIVLRGQVSQRKRPRWGS